MDMSLDDYINQNGIKPFPKNDRHEKYNAGQSKFERYNTDNDDDLDDEEMPQLNPYVKINRSQESVTTNSDGSKKSISQRLGDRSSVCESIHTSQLSLFKPNNRKRFSVHNRLNKNFVSPAVTARKNIVINALKSAESAVQALCDPSDSYYTGNEFLSLVANTNIKQEPKYNMKIQKEISQLQGKQLAFTRGPPGLNVVSTDGVGIVGFGKIPQNTTSMSLNQRFT